MGDLTESSRSADIEGRLLAAIKAAGLDAEAGFPPEALGMLDHFHSGGRRATQELLDLLDFGSEARVLDIGAGIGGPARMIASLRRCRVTCVEPSADYCRAARLFNRLTGLADRVEVLPGSALSLPLEDSSFDLVWMQNVGMSIADKATLYRELRRVLRTGGRFAFQEILAGGGGEPYFPATWARTALESFLVGLADLGEMLRAAGFEAERLEDVTSVELRRPPAGAAQGPLTLAVWVGDVAATAANNRRGLEQGRLLLVRGVFRAA
jgi:SAM-dependent methyltransferase